MNFYIRVLFAFVFFGQILAQSSVGDVVGKLTVGYQGWFGAKGDGSPHNSWIHWGGGNGPSPGKQGFEIWPDVREYTHTYQTGYKSLGNGKPAKLFSSWDDQSVDTHFKWMQQNNIDVAAVQRFASHLKRDHLAKDHLNGIARKVKVSAEKHNRKFYIMWDISGWTNYTSELIEDLEENLNKTENLFSSKAYAKQNGRHVLCIWGFGVSGRPNDTDGALNVIKHLKTKGFYVIGGVPKQWREDKHIPEGFMDVFKALDMLSPWTVGSMNGVAGAANYLAKLKADHEFLKAHNVDYQPVLFPGFSWANLKKGSKPNPIPRLHGDFMWQQFVNLKELGIKNTYVAMFDEYDEGTAIAKAAEDKSMAPTDQYFLTLDADGVHVSSDFYLRLVGDGNRMVKGETPLVKQHPTKHVL